MKKNPIFFIAFSFSLLLFLSCQEKVSSNEKKTVLKEKLIDTVKGISNEKSKSSLVEKKVGTFNNKNVVSFLKNYGKQNPETQVLFETRLGNIKIKLYKDTPLHRANFIFMIKNGYYNTTCFHRIVPGFIVQGGNSDSPVTRKMRMKYNYTLPAEMKSHRKHKYGALAAAREWDNNPKKRSSAFEFYMIQDKRGAYHLEGEHTVYGEIIEGFSTMNKIAKLETDKKEWPLKEVFIKASVIK